MIFIIISIKIILLKLIVLNFIWHNNVNDISLVHNKLNNIKLIYIYIYIKNINLNFFIKMIIELFNGIENSSLLASLVMYLKEHVKHVLSASLSLRRERHWSHLSCTP